MPTHTNDPVQAAIEYVRDAVWLLNIALPNEMSEEDTALLVDLLQATKQVVDRWHRD